LLNPGFDSTRPAGVVRAASADDVRASIRFARDNALACVPKSGGHSFVGASTVENGFFTTPYSIS
jgi:FAD/FMN-containing dehydrogenase